MCVSTMDCCRVCARHSQEYISLHGEEAQLRDLAFKLRFCLHMNVSDSDNLPSTLCWKCVARLDTCYEFMQEHFLGQEELRRQQYYYVQQRCASPESGMYDESDSEELKVNEPMVMMEQQSTNVQKWQPKNFDTSSRADNVHIGNLRLCKCERCTLTRYGSLPLVVDNVDVIPSSTSNDDGRLVAVSSPSPSSSASSAAPAAGVVKVEQPSSSVVVTPSSRKELSCDFCSKMFTHAGDLKKHRRTHTGEKPYECPDCHKMFSHTSNLVRHRKIHSGERPYTCPVCKKAFGRSDKMLGHIKTAHPSYQIPQSSS